MIYEYCNEDASASKRKHAEVCTMYFDFRAYISKITSIIFRLVLINAVFVLKSSWCHSIILYLSLIRNLKCSDTSLCRDTNLFQYVLLLAAKLCCWKNSVKEKLVNNWDLLGNMLVNMVNIEDLSVHIRDYSENNPDYSVNSSDWLVNIQDLSGIAIGDL